ncbi:MAG TPA: PepSY-associated TM helix domain-containing protein [Woeseiaceae bacterium]|nr:PepSY-associated TM helix domain-containing protein [Woeseiaceae bacterium]
MAVKQSLVFRLHKWFGLAIAAWVLLQAVTGTANLYRAELNRLLHAGVLTVPSAGPLLPIDRWIDAARRAEPGAAVERIDYPARPGDAVLVTLQCPGCGGHRLVAVDPHTAAITAHGGLERFPVEAAFWLHSHLWIPPVGKYVVGGLGLVVVGMAATGIWLWWPRPGTFRHAFRIVRRLGRLRFVLDLHRVPGIVTSAAVLFVAATGVALSYSGWLAAALRPVMPFAEPPKLEAPGGPELDSREVQPLVDAARAGFPDSRVRDVRLSAGLVRVLFRPETEGIPRATRQVYVRRHDGKVLARVDPATLPAGDRVIRWLLPLHSGHYGGGAGSAVGLVAGLGLAVLAVTGVWMWFSRREMRARTAARAMAGAAAAANRNG